MHVLSLSRFEKRAKFHEIKGEMIKILVVMSRHEISGLSKVRNPIYIVILKCLLKHPEIQKMSFLEG